MKPWEETWVAGLLGLYSVQQDSKIAHFEGAESLVVERGLACAKLAAQAPAMAKFLLAALDRGDFDIMDRPSKKTREAEDILRNAGVLPALPAK